MESVLAIDTRFCKSCFKIRLPNKPPNQQICRNCAPSNTWRWKWSVYRLTKPMYDAMYFDQNGNCWVCEEKEAIDIDHCHTTGKVRGLLCRSCNNSIEIVERFGDKINEYLIEYG